MSKTHDSGGEGKENKHFLLILALNSILQGNFLLEKLSLMTKLASLIILVDSKVLKQKEKALNAFVPWSGNIYIPF